MEFKYHFNKSCSMSIARNCGNEYYININRGKNAFPLSFYIDPNRLLKIMEELHRMSGGLSTRPVRWEDQNERHFVFTLYNGEVDKKKTPIFYLASYNKDGDEEVNKVFFEICLNSGDCKILANQMFKFLKRIMH